MESSRQGVNHRNVSIISIVETIRREGEREREKGDRWERRGKSIRADLPLISLPIYGTEHPYRIIVLVLQFRCHDTSRVKVLRLVITPINYEEEEEEEEDWSVFVAKTFSEPREPSPMMLHCAQGIINVNRCSHRCCNYAILFEGGDP